MVRRIPPRKVTYFEPVPPRLARNTIIESTFDVGRRFRCTMRVDCGQLDPAAVIRPVVGEWQPRMPERLDDEELADWRAGRNAIYHLAALAIIIFAIRWREFDAVRHATPASAILAYGVLSLKKTILILSIQRGFSLGSAGTISLAAVIFCWLAGLLTFGLSWRRPTTLDPSLLRSTRAAGFALFGSIYVLSFAVGSNFDYRLIYLIPTLPFALDLARQNTHSRWGIAYIVATLLSLNWLNDSYGAGLLLEHGAPFLLFLMVLSVLAKQTRYYLSDANQPDPAVAIAAS